MQTRAKRRKKRDPRQIAFTRFMLIVAIMVLWIGGISARLVHLQVTQHDWLKDRAAAQRSNVKRSKQPRGAILDRNNRALALSVNLKTLFADATKLEDIHETANKLSGMLGLDSKKLFDLLDEAKSVDRRFVPIAKGLDEKKVQEINKLLEDPKVKKEDYPKYTGLHWREEQRRSYPNGSLAAHIVGFSNAEGIGQAGMEQARNEILYGAVVKKVQERDRLGRVYDETISEKEPPKDVVLTIQNSVQYKTEVALEQAARSSGAKSASAVVIANKTGEVLALANYPTYDPNDLAKINSENLPNRAIQSIYSPGSAFKLVTYASALESGQITPDGLIDPGSGVIEVGGHRFKDSHAIGTVTYARALAASSNVCAIKTSLRVGKQGFYESIQNFGFGRQTGIELPAEARGIVRPPERWNGDSMASMAIGYEIGVSLLQMATAFATIANDGVRIQPHIIKEIRQSDQTVFLVSQPERTRVVSEKTARDLRTMLREVVMSGTGKLAKLDNYTSAGKTGTAWKFDEKLKRVNSAKYVSSFIGFAPADKPEITIAVVFDEPVIGGRNGGQVAAPVFREIAEQVLPELNVPPDGEFSLPAAAESQTARIETEREKLEEGQFEASEDVSGDLSAVISELPQETTTRAKSDNDSETAITRPSGTNVVGRSRSEIKNKSSTKPISRKIETENGN